MRTRQTYALRPVLALLLCCLACAPATAAEPIDFAQQVQPILSKYCYACHGPDKQKSGLRLDIRDDALKPADSDERAIVPGDAVKSRLMKVIDGRDEEFAMPPKGAKPSPQQVALIKQWITEGAKYNKHWSFIAPVRPMVPAVKNEALKDWPRNAIDHFILDRLQRQELSPSPMADPFTLIRRVSFDLVGIPPTPQEADAFASEMGDYLAATPQQRMAMADPYEKLVDRLLASPHYGERWARRWLDLARYADTNGYEKDRTRTIWPYRDWVIKALNDDMPFDQFTREQLAGDLLAAKLPASSTLNSELETRNSLLTATGFHRNTMINEEGGIDVEEFRYHAVVDRVSTTSASWLGLTVQCAQCHTHKYDPITHKEYFQLFAFFNNADEPEYQIATADTLRQREEMLAKIREMESKLADRFPLENEQGVAPNNVAASQAQRRSHHLQSQLEKWIEDQTPAARPWTVLSPASVTGSKGGTFIAEPDGAVLVQGDNPNQNVYIFKATVPLKQITALRLEVLPDESLPHDGPGRAPLFSEGDFHLGEIMLSAVAQGSEAPAQKIVLHNASHSYAQSGRSAALAIDGDLDTAWSIKGATGKAHQAVFQLKESVSSDKGFELIITLDQRYIHQMTIGKFRLSVTSGSAAAKASDLPAEIEAIFAKPQKEWSDDDRAVIQRQFLLTTPLLAAAQQEIAQLRNRLPRGQTTMIMQERDAQHARTTQIRNRGEFLQPTDAVVRGVPWVLHPLAVPAEKATRLDLANWLVDAKNPLVGRVVMNRQWEAIFGRGLVKTTEDFGLQGDKPTHPDLLDWLAIEFFNPTPDTRRLQQRPEPLNPKPAALSMKHMHKLIVTSATYRQASDISPQLLRADPDNILLARAPRLRLEAEMLRDGALTAAGLLSKRIGGPSVFPPQPEGVTSLGYGGFKWPTATGEDRYRRGLYTFAKRTTPFAAFVTFDGPTGETCLVRRGRSNNPLQALTLMNDPVFVEAAQAIAQRVCSETRNDDARLDRLFRLVLIREPSKNERTAIGTFIMQQRQRFENGELNAKLIAGEVKDKKLDVNEVALWTTVARSLMNLDEAVTKE